ncbi:aminotransferase-like mobile domain-containing protein [Tanacetum coccineum]
MGLEPFKKVGKNGLILCVYFINPRGKKQEIYNVVLNSSYEIVKNTDLILGFAKNWCDETKTFVFNWGEVTITLEDMMVIGGFSVLGHSVFDLVDIECDETKLVLRKLNEARSEFHKSRYNKTDQFGWMKKFKDSGSEIEHVAGVRLALAPHVLASIYRDLSLLNHNLGNDGHDDESNLIVWAPFQLVQVWILERFRKISPNCVDSCNPRFARWENKKLRMENVGSFVDCGFDDFIWQPFGEVLNDKSGKWVVVAECLDEELESWVRCLRVSELVGMDGKYIEQYLPHRVAMQFGMNQDVPGDVARMNGNHGIAWRYLEWWNKSTGECSLQSPIDDNKTEKFGKDESSIEGPEDSMDVDTIGFKLEARITKLEEIFTYLKARKNGETIILAGLLSPTDGFMYVRKPRSFVFQNPDHQVVMPTVEADVAFGLGRFNLSNDETKLRGAKALTAVGISLARLRRTPSACLYLRAYPSIGPGPDGLDPTRKQTSLMLSEPPLDASLSQCLVINGGQKQRVAIAGALVEECKVLLLDELTTFLDESDQLGVIKAVKNTLSSSEDVTALWVTHRLEELEYADGAVYMEDGRVVMHGEASTVMDSIKARKASYTNSINC